MIYRKCFFLMACAFLGAYDAAYVDTHTCSTTDEKCLKDMVHSALQKIGKNGIEQLNIPPINPLHIKDVSISLSNIINITILDGVIKGLSDCDLKKFDLQVAKGKGTVDVLCDLQINGKSKIQGSSKQLEAILGSNAIHGGGKFNIILSKVEATLIFRYQIVKQDDGDLYIKFNDDKFRYKYALGGFHIDADNIYVGENDASKFFVDFMNSNWKMIIKSFGNNFVGVAMNVMNGLIPRYFDHVPIKTFFSDDLTSLVKNDE